MIAKGEAIACTLASTILRKAACVPSGVMMSMSKTFSSMGRPFTPPAALICLAASLAPFR